MGITTRRQTAHDLQLTHTRFEHAAQRRQTGASDDDVVRLHIGLRGEYSVRYRTLDREFGHLGPHWSLFYARPFALEAVPQAPALETFGLNIPVARFVNYVAGTNARVSRFCDRITSGHAGFLYEPSATLPAALEHTIRRMLASRYDGALGELYLLSQSLELLTTALALSGERSRLLKHDRDSLQAARELIDGNLCAAPPFAAIAKAVGLNEYKLKQGFKQVFGTSVIAYRNSQRLELARRMLLDTDKTAAEVGFALGYATPQHFSQAFKKHFGTSPKMMRKAP